MPSAACLTYEPLLPLVTQHMLDAATAAEVQIHVAQCDYCRAFLDRDAMLNHALRATMQRRYERAPMTVAAIQRLLERDVPVLPRTAPWQRLPAFPVAAVAMLTAFVVIFALTVVPVVQNFLGPTSFFRFSGPLPAVYSEATVEAAAWNNLNSRPFQQPALVHGEACPVSPLFTGTGRLAAISGLGKPPAYLYFKHSDLSSGTLTFAPPSATIVQAPIWGHQTGWVWISPSYSGRYLVRVRQLDGAGQMRFTTGKVFPVPETDPDIRAFTENDLNGWTQSGFMAFVQNPGCYAMQVDGISFSESIVFRAVQEP